MSPIIKLLKLLLLTLILPSLANGSHRSTAKVHCVLKDSKIDADSLGKLGKTPHTVELPDEDKPGEFHRNPDPKDADTFIRAASGVSFIDPGPKHPLDQDLKILVAQDSRRELGLASFSESIKSFQHPHSFHFEAKVDMFPVADEWEIAKYEDDNRDYESYRKKWKTDAEAMATLPGGRILVLTSGSKMNKFPHHDRSMAAQAIVVDPKDWSYQSYSLVEFYKALENSKEVVGEDKDGERARLNIEGVTIRPYDKGYLISFFHRGNMNNNGHNSIIEYDLKKWKEYVTPVADAVVLENRFRHWHRLYRITGPWVSPHKDPKKTQFPTTINDGLFGYQGKHGVWFIPLGVESNYIDENGKHHDGEVIFAGIAKITHIDSSSPKCVIHQLSGDDEPGYKSIHGKIEGLAAFNTKGRNAFERSLYIDSAVVIGVTDIDDENTPSEFSRVYLWKPYAAY